MVYVDLPMKTGILVAQQRVIPVDSDPRPAHSSLAVSTNHPQFRENISNNFAASPALKVARAKVAT
jgi:hypothetical protein